GRRRCSGGGCPWSGRSRGGARRGSLWRPPVLTRLSDGGHADREGHTLGGHRSGEPAGDSRRGEGLVSQPGDQLLALARVEDVVDLVEPHAGAGWGVEVVSQ